MADPWRLSLAEKDRLFRLSVDHRGELSCSSTTRTGQQERVYDNGWHCRFSEGGAGETHGARSVKTGKARSPGPDAVFFDGGQILERHSRLLDFLSQSECAEWRVRFRGRIGQRFMTDSRGRKTETRHTHYGIHVRFRPHSRRMTVDVGEGNVSNMNFNVDGMVRRIGAICANWKNRRRIRLEEPIPVVLHAGEGAIFFHEILGHALEADYVVLGRSPFSPLDLGRRLLPAGLTLQTADNRDDFLAAFTHDDDGERRKNLVLVEDGVLRHFITDFHHSRFLKKQPAGHSRLEDFSHLPQPRMFGLYLQPGNHAFEEIVASVSRGIFAREFSAGEIDLLSGKFWFSAAETFLVEAGRITDPAGMMRFCGELKDIVGRIAMIGNDSAYDKGISYCRKKGQVLPVRVGQPTVKIERLAAVQVSDA